MKKLAGDLWFVYILRCADASLYTGIARDVNRRPRSTTPEPPLGTLAAAFP